MKYNYTYDPRPETISYAQNREDIITYVLLSDVKKGFYVDIGANHPVSDSVTQFFYERGWSGINVEPSASLMKLLTAQRKRDINLQLAVGDAKSTLTFREYKGNDHGLSTLTEKVKSEHATEGLKYQDYSVQVVTLKYILDTHAKGKDIDFLKIDVEGYEYEVIKGNDWNLYRPKIVIIEANHLDKDKDWKKVLQSHKYTKVFFDGLNEYYAADEYLPNIDFTRYPGIVLTADPIISWNEFNRRDTILGYYERDLKAIKEDLQSQNKRNNERNEALVQENEKLTQQLAYANQHLAKFIGKKVARRLKRGVR